LLLVVALVEVLLNVVVEAEVLEKEVAMQMGLVYQQDRLLTSVVMD